MRKRLKKARSAMKNGGKVWYPSFNEGLHDIQEIKKADKEYFLIIGKTPFYSGKMVSLDDPAIAILDDIDTVRVIMGLIKNLQSHSAMMSKMRCEANKMKRMETVTRLEPV